MSASERQYGHRDAEAVGSARGLDAEKARLPRRQLDHAVGHLAIAGVPIGALAAEDDGVIGWCGSLGEGRHAWSGEKWPFSLPDPLPLDKRGSGKPFAQNHRDALPPRRP